MSERIAAVARERGRSRSRGTRRRLNSGGTGLANRSPSSSEALQIRTARIDDGGICVALSGDLTAATEPRLAECLDEALDDYVRRIVVDLSGLRIIAPVAVGTLLIAHRRACDDHRELSLIRGSNSVQNVIDSVDGPFRYTR